MKAIVFDPQDVEITDEMLLVEITNALKFYLNEDIILPKTPMDILYENSMAENGKNSDIEDVE